MRVSSSSSDGGSGPFADPTAAAAARAAQKHTTAGFTSEDTRLPLTGPRAYLDVSPAAGHHPFYGGGGPEGVYTNGRYREEHRSPRPGGGSRDPSAERSHGAASCTPCGIMKVSLEFCVEVTQKKSKNAWEKSAKKCFFLQISPMHFCIFCAGYVVIIRAWEKSAKKHFFAYFPHARRMILQDLFTENTRTPHSVTI